MSIANVIDKAEKRAIEATTSKYVKDFETLFIPIKDDQLITRARNGNLGQSQFRSICWRYFLGCLPKNCEEWQKTCTESRQRYDEIKTRNSSARAPEQDDLPKSTDLKSYIKDSQDRMKQNKDGQGIHKMPSKCDLRNIYRIIERDVVRTFPDMEFFRQSEVQETLISVLFNYACENYQLSYKQGMHELLATLLYVVHTDTQNCLINYQGGYANEVISDTLEMKYIEHDLYHLFTALMKSISSWYQNDEILFNQDAQIKTVSGLNRSARQQVHSVLGLKLKMISENIVRDFDCELFNHLEALQIAPQIYGIRWMRLLFGREFEFLDLLNIWDAIICDQVPMGLTEYVFASMLITNRDELVNGDYTDCLNNLMRHQFKDTSYVINLALHLRDPHKIPHPKITRPVFNKNKYSLGTSLTSKLSQQYRRVKPENISNNQNHQGLKSLNMRGSQTGVADTRRNLPAAGGRDMRQIFSTSAMPKEYEMREMQSSRGKATLDGEGSSLNVSSESYDDLHSIVDYCWRLLSEQIDSLQRCLPNEKSLNSEDEIFVALAQLKKVRDVLKGSLKLEASDL